MIFVGVSVGLTGGGDADLLLTNFKNVVCGSDKVK